MAPNCTSNRSTTHFWYSSEVQLQSKAPEPSQLFAGISQCELVSSPSPATTTMSTMAMPTMTNQCASSAFLSCRSQSLQQFSGVNSTSRLHRRPSSPLTTSTNTTTTSTTTTFCSLSATTPSPPLMSSTLITITRHHLCQILERLSGSVRTTTTTTATTTKTKSNGGVSMAAAASTTDAVAASTSTVGCLAPTHLPTPLPSPLTSRLSTMTSQQRLQAASTTIHHSLPATSNASSSSSAQATFIKSILRDAVNEPVNYQPSKMMTDEHLSSVCSCQTQLFTTGYHDSAECRLNPIEDAPVELPLPSTQTANISTIANRSSAAASTANTSSRQRRHHHRRPTPWSSVSSNSWWWSRLLSSSTSSMTSSATSSLFVTLLLVIFSTMLHTADSCSSRSTPKPRPPTPTTRPNITFQTYACPEAYAKWYCLNGATCFSVRIGESILYNCECSDGYMGQRCEFKDLDGSYLPSREKILVETAGIAGGVTLAVILVVIFSVYYYTYVRNQRRAQEQCSAPLLEDDSCSSTKAATSPYRDHLGGHDNGAFNDDYNNDSKSSGAGYHHQRNSNLMQHYQHQSASKSGSKPPVLVVPSNATDQLTLLCSSTGKQYGSIQNRASTALPQPPSSSQCIVCLNTNLHHQMPTTTSSHVLDLESGCQRPVPAANPTNAFFSC